MMRGFRGRVGVFAVLSAVFHAMGCIDVPTCEDYANCPANGAQGNVGDGGPESCANNLDDDGNGVTDCADPACQLSRMCVGIGDIPEGFLGPVAVRVGSSLAPVVDCADGSPLESFYSVTAVGATCVACGCDASSVTCGVDDLQCDDASVTCKNLYKTQPFSDVCQLFPQGNFLWSCRLPLGSFVSSGACVVTGGGVAPTPPMSERIDVCPLVSPGLGGCPQNAICAPVAGATTEKICIYRPGNFVCPGDWPTTLVAHQAFDDSRACTACNCQTICMGGGYRVYAGPDCSTPTNFVDGSGTCVDVTNAQSWHGEAAVGACNAFGGDPVGAAVPLDVSTFCCR